MTQFTQEQIEYYIKNSHICPFCGSSNMAATEQMQVDGDEAWQTIECYDCGNFWHDIYRLTGMEQIEEKEATYGI